MQGSTKHLICWSLGHGVKQPKSEANNEVISFTPNKRKLNKGKSTLKNNMAKYLGGHTLIMIGLWYQKSNSNEIKTACPFHWPQKTSHRKRPLIILSSETECLLNSAELGRDWRELCKYVTFWHFSDRFAFNLNKWVKPTKNENVNTSS